MVRNGVLKSSFCLFLFMSFLIIESHHLHAENITLVKNKEAFFRIVVAENPDRWLSFAANDLSAYISKSTGAKLEIVTNTIKKDGIGNIHLGETDYVKKLNLKLPKQQGFVIKFPDSKNIVIIGPSMESGNLNTSYGVSYFLRTYLGIRWLFPGELGEHVPKLKILSIPTKDVWEEPAFLRRDMSGLPKAYKDKQKRLECLYWGIRQGYLSKAGLRINHNIGNILHPDKYIKTHPEFFPLINGKRFFPKHNSKDKKWHIKHWDPCYSAEGIVEEAAKNLIIYFDENPDKLSVSLSINDSAFICECKKCREKNKNFPDNINSQSYYEWVNAVVKKVREKHPDKYFGLLAYSRVSLAPENIKLDDHIVPIICRDLLYWADPKLKQIGYERVKTWSKIAPTLGWWDYSYGGPYIVPRVYFHHLADTLKYLYKNNLRFYHTELYPSQHWKNVPQAYLQWKILWDSNVNTDEVLNEWFELAVGKKAAPYFKEYFSFWEDFWTNRAIKTDWFQRGAKTRPFLARRELRYLKALNNEEDMNECEKLLKKTFALAETEKQKERAKFFLDYFVNVKNEQILPYIFYAKMAQRKPTIKKQHTIYKYGYDKGKEKWNSSKRNYSTAVFRHDKMNGRTKKGSLLIDNRKSKESPLCFLNKNLKWDRIEHGKTYKISVWCKTKDMLPGGFVKLLIRFNRKEGGFFGADAQRKRIYQFVDSLYEDTGGSWKNLTVYFKVPKNAWKEVASVYCQLAVRGAGDGSKYWFDDFSFDEVELD